MKKVITRLFSDEKAANNLARSLLRQGFPREDVTVYTNSDQLAADLTKAGVNEDTAKAYASKIGDGAVCYVGATYVPLGAAKIARTALAAADTVDMGGAAEENRVKQGSNKAGGLVSRGLGLPLIEHRRWGSLSGKEYMIQTGVRWGSFGGKKNMIQTGKRWGSFGGMGNMIQTGKRWGSFGGMRNMIQTGKRWGGPAPLLATKNSRSQLQTGKRWGGPVPLLASR